MESVSSSMELAVMVKECKVCNSTKNIQTGYGTLLCNACKTMYRRATDPDPAKVPKNLNVCKQTVDHAMKCAKCRVEKCFAVGLNRFRGCDDLTNLVKNLMKRNEIRSNHFLNSQPREDLSLEQIMEIGTIRFTPRTVNPEDLNSHQWANLQMVTTIEFMKTFDVMRYLEEKEITTFIKRTYFNLAIFFMAMSSYFAKRAAMMFPGNKDVFPEECAPIYAEGSKHQKLFEDIRCNLIFKFAELKITKEELLILSVIIACGLIDPEQTSEQAFVQSSDSEVSPKPFSDKATTLILQYRKLHIDRLQELCLLKDRNGPGRFYALISVMETVTYTMAKLNDTLILFELYKTSKNLSKLVKDYFEPSDY